ncbi:OmpA family protein [Hymenobacter taeanensis]|uniref:OmpA family protein n=1 Tax=Hymenobacter taeanensis TaxID=2735321 RepID=A0A6M6BI58_9BACT|nr:MULTISPECIES: RICIN domain-containing protein [Hymenobacter]QJX47786.1 OmpA family protein [Hymenobacter taeanensis]UOQ82726.1 RICIN domain-containing protein [Hymenobacter sp. 5414T-23]
MSIRSACMTNTLTRLLLPLLAVWLITFSAAGQAAFVPDASAWYGLIPRSSGRSLDIANSSTEAGAAAVQWEFTHSNSQQWRFVPAATGSDFYRIEARHSGKCLTLESPDENAPLVQRPWTGSFYQQWKLIPSGPLGSFMLVSRGNDKCVALAAADKFNGTPIVGQRVLNRASQQWKLFKLRLNVDASKPGFGQPEPLMSLNTPGGNELQPVPTPDGKTLYFVRTRYAGNTEGVAESGDIWVSTAPAANSNWAPATRLDALNTPQHNGVMAVVGASGESLLVRGRYERDGSYRDESASKVARNLQGKNVRPAALIIPNYYSAGPATSFYMTPDEQFLLLSLERGDSQGGNDLYLCRPTGDGIWSEPMSLGNVVNSPGYDFAPWLSADTKTLYFSSYGHAGFGNADIFVSERLDDSWTRWSEPRNVGAPLNGPGFDAYLALSADGKQAFYASAPTPNSPADLFRTAASVARPDTVPVPQPAAPTNPAVAARILLTGRTLDAKTRQGLGTEVKAIRLGNDLAFNATARTESTGGAFQMTLPPGSYRLQATRAGYLTATDTVTLTTGSLSRELLLVPAAVGSSLELPTLIFAQGKYSLLPASYTELNRLARTLQDNPTVNIRLEGHTDNQGNAKLNQELSESRVAEVKRYLVTRGITENRITTVGYGGSRPRASNDKEETRKLNRRVEFTITK